MSHAILDAPRPVAFAHRGGAALYPENTLLAFDRAVAMGCRVLELDVHVTRDGKLAVFHDETVERTTNGHGAVSSFTLKELKQLDAGYRFSTDGLSFPYRGRDLSIPSLDEVLRALPEAAFNVEIKQTGDGARLLWDSIKRHDLASRVLVAARHHSVLRSFRKLSDETVATGASRREIIGFRVRVAAGLELAGTVPYRALQLPLRAMGVGFVNRKTIRVAHAAGVRVHAWTIDDVPTMRALIDIGVDGIMTDRPDLLLELLPS